MFLSTIIIRKKNIWNKICSANDWIHVAIIELQNKHNFSKNMKGNMDFVHFILTLDILSSSVEEMWRSFVYSSNKMIKYPLENSKDIFHDKKIYDKAIKSDKEYFEHIRAFFGFHSSNGNEENVLINGKTTPVRFFSSWPNQRNDDEFEVILYSNNDEAERLYGGILSIHVDDLIKYASLRYQSLKELQVQVKQFYNYIMSKSFKEVNMIKIKNDNLLSSITQLKRCANENYMGSLYKNDINNYINFLNVNLSVYSKDDTKIVLKYLDKLNKVIPISYKKALLSSDDNFNDNFQLFNNYSKFSVDNSYDIGKILEFKHGENNDIINYQLCFNELINKNLMDKYTLKLSYYELMLLIESKSYYSKIKNPNYSSKSTYDIKKIMNKLEK
ncbi:hypothetical protein DY138_03740 [Apilactobacillus timberlakei]|uniref:hypothetical protein n=1 Tax=Apilactobacillus timberlakei TaxID=2008380 RepID=UPI001129ECBA|nr:hypothetical protein [Apilactobacillus timberlakei]TPR18738.1 hypothetical protein DY138_03740 [Apilactobacillus timberlakei]TPR21097.1 hypothetical protein DY061_03395 [Apilactobacillus timberlakei]TPR23748.1 hypothetical protein DY083_01265 [Apilactobacillus timberlakei]